MKNKSESNHAASGYWDSIATKSRGTGHEDLWRAYLRDVYQDLGARWGNGVNIGRKLKTDLYDEAISRHSLLPMLENERDQVVGVDISFETARAAKRQLAEAGQERRQIAVSDARNQAFQSNVFGTVLSNSTLDHFANRSDIMASLEELHRILKRGGMLIITLDNPQNPVVWIRNRLPYSWLKRLGIIPYYMGVTLSRFQLIRALESSGFEVQESTAIVHSPRVVAIWAGLLLGRMKHDGIKASFRRLLGLFECLERLPTKDITGYFVAVKAVKV